jgi:hypothetical protein
MIIPIEVEEWIGSLPEAHMVPALVEAVQYVSGYQGRHPAGIVTEILDGLEAYDEDCCASGHA